MSPNGRRRFRKMNRRFRQRGPAGVRERARKTTGGMARKMILVQYWGRDPLPLPVKPFTARSLVGMTMGARKKAWLSNALYPVVFPSGIITDETDMQAGYSWPEIRYDWPLLGERLRPCEGCEECRGYDDGIGVIHCDGSGVLPARRS